MNLTAVTSPAIYYQREKADLDPLLITHCLFHNNTAIEEAGALMIKDTALIIQET